MDWELVAAVGSRFSGRFGHRAVAYGGSLWVVGGSSGSDEIWRSADGGSWELVAAVGSRFSGRFGHQLVAYGGSLWVIGGSSGGGEVWRSADGVQWEAATLTAGFAAREGSSGGGFWR